jgi:hypothetical protein
MFLRGYDSYCAMLLLLLEGKVTMELAIELELEGRL